VHGTQICHFLNNNKWISNAVVPDTDPSVALVSADISPHGHEMVCKIGLQEFSRRLQDELYSIDQKAYQLEFREVHKQIAQCHQSGGRWGRAAILSWISRHPVHRFLLKVHPETVFLKGHFPERPILAGVVQVHWAISVAMKVFKFSDTPAEIKRLKFRNIVQPPAILELLLRHKKENELEFQFASHESIHSSGCLVLTGALS